MALVTCPDCRKEISDAAINCPGCGRPMHSGSVADADIHGRGEGIFMKGLNCGCAVLIAGVVLLYLVVLFSKR